MAITPAAQLSKKMAQDFKAYVEQGHTHMLVTLLPDEGGEAYYGPYYGPFSCTVSTIGVKGNPSEIADHYNGKDMPVLWTFNLLNGRPFKDQLQQSRMMERFPDMTEPVRRSTYAITNHIPKMPPAPIDPDEKGRKDSFLRRAFGLAGNDATAALPRISALEYKIAQEHDRAQRTGQRAVLLALVDDKNSDTFYKDLQTKEKIPYRTEFFFTGQDQNPYHVIETYFQAGIPIVLALETTTKEPWYKKFPERWAPGALRTPADLYDAPYGCLLDEGNYLPERKTPKGPVSRLPDLRVIAGTERPEHDSAPRSSGKMPPHLRIVRKDDDEPQGPKP